MRLNGRHKSAIPRGHLSICIAKDPYRQSASAISFLIILTFCSKMPRYAPWWISSSSIQPTSSVKRPDCRSKNILFEAWAPLMRGKAFSNPQIEAIAKEHGKDVGQICVRWSLQKGFLSLPKSVHLDRVRSNADVFDLELSSDEMGDGGAGWREHFDGIYLPPRSFRSVIQIV